MSDWILSSVSNTSALCIISEYFLIEELQRLKYLGKQWKYPAWSCGELAERKPDYKSGYYWVQGSQRESPDLVYCDLETQFSQGGKGWLKVANFNMTDPNQECPSQFQFTLITEPKRLCIREEDQRGCSSITFSSSGNVYRLVCGTVAAYQYSTVDGFNIPNCPNPCTINHHYVDGISITHRRKHVWTYAHARGDCTAHAPHFVGNSYSCQLEFSPTSFCRMLPQPTTDSLEVRVCRNQDRADEDIRLELIELYIQ